MIPARLGSTRVKDKCIRYLGNKPLVQHVIDTCKEVFPEEKIYLNSSFDVFEQIAKESNINFYRRPEYLSSNEATNDEFLYDFLKHVSCEYVVQVNPTSPFITSDDLISFIQYMLDEELDFATTVKEERIEAIFDGKELNFKRDQQMPRSQDLKPVFLFTSGIFGFRSKAFINNYEKYGYAMYGDRNIKVGYFLLHGFSTLDIDYEDDFRLAEAILELKKQKPQPKYFDSEELGEVNVPEILSNDGVERFKEKKNKFIINTNEIINSYKKKESWACRVIDTENNSATLICQNRNEGNRKHYHHNWNEWWYIISGKWKVEIEDKEFTVSKGDIVFIPKGKKHRITAIEDDSIRLAVSRSDVIHFYNKNEQE